MGLLNYNTYFDDTSLSNSTAVLGERYDGWVITCELWESLGIGIVLPINPEHLNINIPIRGHAYEAAFGKAIAYSLNKRRNTYYDPFNLQLTFNTGYIIPKWSTSAVAVQETASSSSTLNKDGTITQTKSQSVWEATANKRVVPQSSAQNVTNSAYAASRQNDIMTYFTGINSKTRVTPKDLGVPLDLYDTYVPIGTQNLYALMSLLDGAKTWRPNLDYTEEFAMAAPNRIKVYANSLVFPAMTFYCQAQEQGISWAESAETPTCFDVTLNLLCTLTDPQIGRGQLDSLISQYKKNFTIGTLARFSAKNKTSTGSGTIADGTEF